MSDESPRIIVEPNGPYRVEGDLRLVRKAPIYSEYGEPMGWKTGAEVPAGASFRLCRCGQSRTKPFCDLTHLRVGFDGAESALPEPDPERVLSFPGQGLVLRDDPSLCAAAGFCGTRRIKVWQMIQATADTELRARLMAMVERCPSGRLSYAMDPDSPSVEPDLPAQIGLVENGPLWVTGYVTVERTDGTLLDRRSRMTLCRCGHSQNKPYCDGSHEEAGFEDPFVEAGASELGAARNGRRLPEAPPEPVAMDQTLGQSPSAAEAGRYLRHMAEFIGFDEDDAAAVRTTRDVLETALPDLIADFYAHVLRYPPTRQFFLDPAGEVDQDYLELRMRHQIAFWLQAAEARLDDDFAAYIDFAGHSHTSRGADPTIYVAERYVTGMLGYMQHGISRTLTKGLADRGEAEVERALDAWSKFILLLVELFSRAYDPERHAQTAAPSEPVDEAAVDRLAHEAFDEELGEAGPVTTVDVPVLDVDSLVEGERRILTVNGLSIGLFRHRGQWVAIRNRCLHRGGPVATGRLEGDTLICPWHGYRYTLGTGGCLTDPTTRLDSYPVRVRDGQVWLTVPAAAEPSAAG